MKTAIDTDAEVGRAYIAAIAGRDFDALEALLAPDVRFRALTPRTERAASTAQGARDVVEGWFADADPIEEADTSVTSVADRLHLAYRFRLREEGVWKLVEQQAFASIAGGRIADLAIVCSGFRPLTLTESRPAGTARLDALGEDCATLTPRIRTAMAALAPGEVLEVTADDPAAEEGLWAWTRLTGHELVDVRDPESAAPRYYLRRR